MQESDQEAFPNGNASSVPTDIIQSVPLISPQFVKRKNQTRFLCVLLSFFAAGPSASAQVNLNHVSARAGIINDPWSPYGQATSHFLPGVEAGGMFILPYFNWGLSWSYWSDGITQVLPFADFITYSHKAHILSARIAFLPQMLDGHFPIPIDLLGGIAVHLSRASYIGGTGISGNRGESSNSQSATAIIGLRLTFSVISPFSVDCEALQFIPFSNSDSIQKGRREYTLGIMVAI